MFELWACAHLNIVINRNHNITIWINRKHFRWEKRPSEVFLWTFLWFNNSPAAPFHSSAEQHDDDSRSRLHAAPPEQHAAQPSGNQHHQHPQRKCEFQQFCRKEICSLMLIGMTFNSHWLCFSDVSILHEWAALSGIPVSYLSLPAYTPAGVLFNPNWTTGTISKLTNSLIWSALRG